MPLRASNLSYNDLRHMVILGNLEFLRRQAIQYCSHSSHLIFSKDLKHREKFSFSLPIIQFRNQLTISNRIRLRFRFNPKKMHLFREWYLLKNLPKISVMEGSPMSRADLRALKIKLCKTCVILSAKVNPLHAFILPLFLLKLIFR